MNEIDEKVKAWIAGEEKEIPLPTLPYEKKLVAFIDILGVKDKVKEGRDDAAQVVTIMRQIRTYVETECNSLIEAERLNSLQIGDGFFIVSDADCINEICKILSVVQWQVLIDSQMLLRGVLTAIVEKYRSKTKMIRYVDFNQGIDARLINNRNIKLLSTIPIRPFRLACDRIEDTNKFNTATKLAIKNDIRHISNYILYNWKDKPEDLWMRLNNAVSLYSQNGVKIDGFSFPMKYAPIKEKDRSYIGKHWNKKYLSAINVIINVTNGVVAKEKDFFFEAFGSNLDEFHEILCMPDEFIRFRRFFRDNGLIDYWKTLYHSLSEDEKAYLLEVLCEYKTNKSIINDNHPKRVRKILVLYTINKSQFDRGEKSGHSIISKIESL